ncbi:MAG: hypothetical protein U9R19_07355, partial [Bacteroidota bacterium]|nr:hypothetical protein [Bacteroidota bacterium]
MKNKLLKLVFTNLFVFAVLFASVAQVNTYPYVENFDSGIGSWVIDFNTNPMGYDVFEHGNVTDAWFPYYKANATDFYVKTDMDGTYAQETDTWVTSPVFDFTNLIQPELSLDIFADALVGWGGAFINYSIDGISWNRLGSQGDGTNWYDGSFDAYLAWGECWVNTGGGWITADIPLTFLAGESTVSFKVIFKSSTIPATLPGFGFDDFSIDEMAPGTPDPQTVELVSPQDAVCALSSTETVSVNVWNGSTADLVNTWYIQLIVDGSTYAYELISDDVLSNAMYAYTFTATHDFSAAGTYNVTVNTSFDGVNPYNTFTTTVESEGLDEINAFAHFVDFSAPTPEFGYFAGTYTTANIVGGEVVTTGVNGSFWTGGIGSTSAQNAWVDNTEYMAGGYTCNVDATGLGTLELIFDLYQQYSYSPDFCWFRVLVNGMPVADVNGVENHNPDTYEAPAFVELRYDLSAYAGTNLNIEFQSSTKNPTDIVKMDNFLLRQKLQFDLAMLALVSPGTGCGLGMEQVVVEIENIGTSPASGFDVTYILDGGSPVTETFVGAILSGFTGIHTFATAADLTGAGPFSFDVSLSWTNDLDNANDALTGITVNDISNDLTTPYTQDFSGTNNVAPYEYWAIEDANFDGEEWFWLYDHTSQEAYGFDYEGAQGIDFLYTNCFNFDASLNYKICLDYATYLSGDVKGFEVYLSTSQDMSGLVGTPIISMPNVNTSGAYQLATNVFTVPANGVYYIAFKAIGNATFEAEYLFIDNIMITQFVYPDMEVTSVLFIDGTGAPVTNDCMLGDVYVDIEFTNNSGSTLCAGETIEFSYFVSHNGNVWAPVYETHILTAPMQAGDTNPFSFTQSIDMSVQGEYIVSVIVNYSFEGNTANDQNGGNTLINYGTPQNLAIAGFTDGYCFDAPDIYINGSFTDMGYSYDLTLIASEAATSNISYNNWEYNIPEWIDGEIYFTYTVTITNDGLSCTSSIVDTILISNPTVDLGPDIVTTDYLSVLLDAGADPDGTPDFTYVWAPNGETAQQAVPTYYGTYSVSVTEGYCTVTDEITVFQEQEIDLRQGWGLWSTLIDANTITTSIDLEDVATNGGLTDVIIMKDELGLTWWPAGTPPFDQNFIGDIVNGEGYQYKMGTAETLS